MGSDRYMEAQMAWPQQLADANREILRLKKENAALRSEGARAEPGASKVPPFRPNCEHSAQSYEHVCTECHLVRPRSEGPQASGLVGVRTTDFPVESAPNASVAVPIGRRRGMSVKAAQESLPFARSSDTSEAAADSMASKAAEIRERVFEYVKKCGPWGSTCDMAEQALGLSHQTCSARFNELRNRHRIVDSGARRLTRSGRKAVVYTVKP